MEVWCFDILILEFDWICLLTLVWSASIFHIIYGLIGLDGYYSGYRHHDLDVSIALIYFWGTLDVQDGRCALYMRIHVFNLYSGKYLAQSMNAVWVVNVFVWFWEIFEWMLVREILVFILEWPWPFVMQVCNDVISVVL